MGIIESRVEELHLLGISHNNVRLANIHVSVSGKFFFIDLDYRTAQITKNIKRITLNLFTAYSGNMVKMANMEVVIILLRLKFLTK